MKRLGYLFEDLCGFDNLYVAFRKALKGSRRTPEVCRFFFNLENELLDLRKELAAHAYRPAPYRYFKIFDPKARTISDLGPNNLW